VFISVTAQGVSKGSAVQALVASQKLELKNVMAVGDSIGDLPMLEIVGHPVVMAESPEALRERFLRSAASMTAAWSRRSSAH
jgi:hydroxymethylpyrimidine pyrophosphatase-like HAD family hydrolase